MNSRQENRLKLSYTARIITKYSLVRFLSICGEKMSKGFLKLCKLISKLILGQIIISNLTNVHKLNSRINYARLHQIRYKKTNIKNNNYLGLPFKMQSWKVSSRPVPLQTLQPSYASSKVKNDFDKWRISRFELMRVKLYRNDLKRNQN